MNTLLDAESPVDPTTGPVDRRVRSSSLPWVGLGLLALLLAFSSAIAISQRKGAIESERRSAGIIANALATETIHHLKLTEAALAGVGQRASQVSPAQSAPLGAALREESRRTPLIGAIFIVDATGRIVASSKPYAAGSRIDMDALGRPGETGGPVFGTWSTPRSSEPAGSASPYALSLSLPGAANGAEASRVVATLNPAFISDRLDELTSETGHRAVLLGPQRHVLAATTSAGLEPGTLVATWTQPGFAEAERVSGSYDGQGIDGAAAIGAFRILPGSGWTVVAERPISHVFETWRETMAWLLAATLVLGLLMAGTIALAWHTLRDHERLQGALAKAKQRLQQNEQQLRDLIEAAPAPMFVLDSAGHFRMVNHAFEDFLGVQRTAVIGSSAPLPTHLQQLAYHPVHDLAVWQGIGRSHYLDDLPAADGRLREALVSKVAIRQGERRPQAVVGSITDVTELREAERHTREAMQIAQRASESKNEFIANMSHGLRTPLQSVLGFAELGRWRSAEQKPLREMFNDIHAAGRRMLMLVNDLLDMSRLESSVGTMHRDMGDVVGITREVIEEAQTACTGRGVAIHRAGLLEARSDGMVNTAPAWVDRLRLQQAVRNVLDNAVRFAPAGSTIDVELTRDADHHLYWTIRDHGPDIPDTEQAYMFEAFFHGQRNRDEGGGFGLGLAIASKIMHAHGGSAWAENHPGGGAVFHLRIPAGAGSRQASPTSRIDVTAV